LTRRALRYDPYREELVRNLLTLLALDERRSEAIQYYQNWSKSLKTELDILPLPATRMVVEEIRAIESLEALQGLRSRLVGAPSPWGPT
jgi:DNA-binding SARP family transcriptional activator